MTAPTRNQTDCQSQRDPPPASDVVVGQVERTCRSSIDGRRAARALAAWAKPFELSEPEFQLLWRLRPLVGEGLDQTSLARTLTLSPAQVSATVERLRRGGWIVPHVARGDRRRQVWQLTDDGHALLAKMLVDAQRLRTEPPAVDLSEPTQTHDREEAA